MSYPSNGGTMQAEQAAYVKSYQHTGLQPVDESASPIRDGVGQAEEIVTALHAAISQLEKRLDTVLTPVPPQPGTAGTPGNGPIASHLRGRLATLNEGYADAVRRLRDLALRVEV